MRRSAFLAAAVLAGCLCGQGFAQRAPAETLGLTIKSWGKPLFDWTLSPDGDVRYTYADDTGSTDFRTYKLVTKRVRVGRKGYAKIAALLAPGRAYAGGAIPCQRDITDMPYGEIRWGDKATRYDLGCRSEQATPVHAGVKQAQDQMMAWAKTARIVETRPIGEQDAQ